MSLISDFIRKIEKLETIEFRITEERTLEDLLGDLAQNERRNYETIQELQDQMKEVVREWNRLKGTKYKDPDIISLDPGRELVTIDSIYDYIKLNYSKPDIDIEDGDRKVFKVSLRPKDPMHKEDSELILLDKKADLGRLSWESLESLDQMSNKSDNTPFEECYTYPTISFRIKEDLDLVSNDGSMLVTVYRNPDSKVYLIGIYRTMFNNGKLAIRAYSTLLNGAAVNMEDVDEMSSLAMEVVDYLNKKISTLTEDLEQEIHNNKDRLSNSEIFDNMLDTIIKDVSEIKGINFVRDTHSSSIYRSDKNRYEDEADGFFLNGDSNSILDVKDNLI